VGLVGCGQIGRRRAEVLRHSASSILIIAVDRDLPRARAVAAEWPCEAGADWREVIERDDIDAVIVSTTHDALTPVTLAALRHGKHVFVEKPMARTPVEAETVCRTLHGKVGDRRHAPGGDPLVVKVGFNHRFHPAIHKAHSLVTGGGIGELYFIRCRYGHGGRPGYASEWRANAEISGGGELLDQGIHAIDLFRWFLGDFHEGFGFTPTYFWRSGGIETPQPTDVEDNAFGLFRTSTGQIATLHASWTQWKNLFSFEVFGREGYLIVDGLGRSYGPERLTWGRRRSVSGSPKEEYFDFPESGISWQAEWEEFLTAIREGRRALGDDVDAWQAIKLAHAVYVSSKSGGVVHIS
jgi:predicted dehydrogenase